MTLERVAAKLSLQAPRYIYLGRNNDKEMSRHLKRRAGPDHGSGQRYIWFEMLGLLSTIREPIIKDRGVVY